MRAPILCLLVLVSTTGCARLVRGDARNETIRVLSQRREQRVVQDVEVQARQTGTQLELSATHICEDLALSTAERETEYGVRLENPTMPILFGVGGAAAIGVGVTAIARPEVIADSSSADPETSTLAARITGGALTALGAALLGIATVDLVRATGSEVARDTFVRTDSITRPAACDVPRPAHGESFELVVSARQVTLGPTDASGRFVVDLVGALRPSDLEVAVATVRSRGRDVGYVDLAPVRDAFDERAWSRVTAGRCAETGSAADCAALIAYLRDFPEGVHAGEARAAAELARARIAEERERIAREQEAERQRRAEEERRWQAEREAELRRYEAERQAELEREQRRAAEERAAQLAREQCQSQCRRGCRGAGSRCAEDCIRATCR